MTWFKTDDKFHNASAIVDDGLDVAAVGLWLLAGTWSADLKRDGFVPQSVPVRWTPRWRKLAAELVAVGLWEETDGGWRFTDWGDQPTKAETESPDERARWRRKTALKRDRGLCDAVVARDKNRCRYCGERVNWLDRKSGKGGTYDHVDPDGINSLVNVVVACRRCNGRKRNRTPDEAGMPLLPVPGAYEPGSGLVAPEKTGTDLTEESGPPRVALARRDGPDRGLVGPDVGPGRVPANGNGAHA